MNEQMVQDSRRGLDVPKLVIGLFLVTLGLAFLFDRLYWWDTHEFFRFWPMWLIAFGLLRVAYPRPGRGRLAGFWPILIGSVFLLDTMDVLSIRESWPLFIVGGGLLMILRASGIGCRPPCDRAGSARTGS